MTARTKLFTEVPHLMMTVQKVLGNTGLGHGDAMHMSDFNNDGVQEVFSVKEDQYKKYAEDLRVASTGKHFWESRKTDYIK